LRRRNNDENRQQVKQGKVRQVQGKHDARKEQGAKNGKAGKASGETGGKTHGKYCKTEMY